AIQPSLSVYKMKQFYKYGLISCAVYLLLFLCVLVFVKNILQVYNIPTGSMEPTIFAGESVFVDKLAYIKNNPKSGDMVVFNEKRAKVPYVKRVVAISGQKVCITDEGRLLVDGQEVSYDNIYYEIDYENSPSLKHKTFLYDGNYIVPEDSYFVVGDNFTNSFDSRHFGPLKKQQIIGQAVRVFGY
ncbi:MAG: signal peptidase I, partial [Planctomycetota bacterium]